MLIHSKDDIEFVTEFPSFFGTPCILDMITLYIQYSPTHLRKIYKPLFIDEDGLIHFKI